MRAENLNKGLMLAAVGLVGVLVLAVPAVAQQNQSSQAAVNGTATPAGSLSAVQTMFGNGQFNADSLGMHSSTDSTSTTLTCSECLCLDTYDASHTTNAPAGNPWILGPVRTSGALTAGNLYVITVTGDVSYWYQSIWSAPTILGTPGNIEYPSDGQCDSSGTHGKSGFDFEYLFAFPGSSIAGGVPQHLPSPNISIDGGVTYSDYVPVGGQVYNPSHAYQYVVVGQGKRAYFRVYDSGPTNDNWGKYKICVQLLTACGNNGCGGGGQGGD